MYTLVVEAPVVLYKKTEASERFLTPVYVPMSFLSVTVSVLGLSVVNTLLLPVTPLVPDWYKWKVSAVLPSPLFIAVYLPAPTTAVNVAEVFDGTFFGPNTQTDVSLSVR